MVTLHELILMMVQIAKNHSVSIQNFEESPDIYQL